MRKKPRFGIALIETLLMISALALIIGLSTSILVSSVRTSRNAEKTLHRLMTRSQLADRFRADVAAARRAEVGDGGLRLRISDQEEILYVWIEGVLERTEKKSGETVSRQEFGAGLHCDGVEFRMPQDSLSMVVMRISAPVGDRKAASVTEVAAALQGDRR